MRIATYQSNGSRRVGLVDAAGQALTPLRLEPHEAARGALSIVERLVAGQSLPPAADAAVPLDSVRLEAPLPLPRRNLWCVGRNYHAHAKELAASVFKASAAKADEWPIVFSKVPECVVGPYADVQLPGDSVSSQIDYEAELAVVIGKGGKNIGRERA